MKSGPRHWADPGEFLLYLSHQVHRLPVGFPLNMAFLALSLCLLVMVSVPSNDEVKLRSQIPASLSFPFSRCGSCIFGITSV